MKGEQLELFDKIPSLEKRAAFTLSSSNEYVCIDDINKLGTKSKHDEVFSFSRSCGEVVCRNRIASDVGRNFQVGDNKYRGISISHYLAISNFLKDKKLVFNKKTLLMDSL